MSIPSSGQLNAQAVLIAAVVAPDRSSILPEGRVWTTMSPFSNLKIGFQIAPPLVHCSTRVVRWKQAVGFLGGLALSCCLNCCRMRFALDCSWIGVRIGAGPSS